MKKSSQEKKRKTLISTIFWILLIFLNFNLINDVSAGTILNETVPLEEFTKYKINYTEEDIWNVAIAKGIDTTVYNGYLVTLSLNSSSYVLNIFYFNKDSLTNDNFYLDFNGTNWSYYQTNSIGIYKAKVTIYSTYNISSLSNETFTLEQKNVGSLLGYASSSTTFESPLYYYTNANIYVKSSNSYLESNEKKEDYIDYTNSYSNYNKVHYEWWDGSQYSNEEIDFSFIKRIINAMNKRNTYYLVRFTNDSDNDSFFTGISIYEYDSIPYFYLDETNDEYSIFRTNIIPKTYGFSFSTATVTYENLKKELENKLLALENNIAVFSISTTNILLWPFHDIETNINETGNRNVVYYSNFDLIYNDNGNEESIKIGDEIISNGEKLITLSEYLGVDLEIQEKEFKYNNAITKLYGIDYRIYDDSISDKIQISFKYDGENKPEFNGIVTYGLKNHNESLNNELYSWTSGPGYGSSTDTGVSYGEYTETYENNIYTLTLENFTVNDINSEFEDIIIRFEFLWATYVSDIIVKSNNLYSEDFYINSFGYDYIVDTFNTTYFSYINFSTSLEEYRGTFYLINTLKDNEKYQIFPDYFSTDIFAFSDFIIPSKVYTSNFGYDNIIQFNFNIGISSKIGFWLTKNFNNGRSSFYPVIPDVIDYDFRFLVAYKMNENLYFSYNQDEDNKNAIITDGLNEDNKPNITITDIEISDDIVTSSDYKNFFTIVTGFLDDLKDTRNSINELYDYFYTSLPKALQILHDVIIIICCLIIFIKVGVEQ